MAQKLIVYEEETNLIWGLIVVVTTAAGTYLIGDAFADDDIFEPGIRQILALVLFTVTFVGIVKISEQLFRFDLLIEEAHLTISVYKGDTHIKNLSYNLNEIEYLGFRPRTPPRKDEALLDFTPNYHLMIKLRDEQKLRRLIELEGISFTLKVDDIGRIIRFIRKQNPSIRVDEDMMKFF